ncbi:MAG: peptidoglycan-binding protein [Proteobacteria bacterium]|nr:peptidoglycan-binding protein [Pseudomonadota bacterium]
MRMHAFAGGLLFAAVVAVSGGVPHARAQPAPTLAYVQPLSPEAVGAIQHKLQAAGLYNGRVDGVWGPDSDLALQRYQQSHQLQTTGQMNQATAATMGLDVGQLTTTSQPLQAAPLPAPDRLRAASVRALQTRLATLGFYRGAVDGVWGQSTMSALQAFQQGRGWQPNGDLNPATISALGLSPDALAYR